jgi:hypothetical protein
VDQFVLRGSASATKVQRTGIALIGGAVFCTGIAFWGDAMYSRDIFELFLGAPFIALGFKILSNAFLSTSKDGHSGAPPERESR